MSSITKFPKPRPVQLYNSNDVGLKSFVAPSIPKHLLAIPRPRVASVFLAQLANEHSRRTKSNVTFNPADLANPDFDELDRMSKTAITMPEGITDVTEFTLPDDLSGEAVAEDEGGAGDPNLNIVSISKKGKSVPLTEQQWKFLKDSQWRDEFLRKMGVDPKKNLMMKIVHLAFLSVDPGTFRSYASHWKKMRENGCPINYAGLMAYLAKFPASIKTDSLNSWVSAVKLYMRAFGQEGQATLLRLVTDGYAHDNPNGLARERGIIDRGKIQQLASHPSIKGTPYELGYQLQFATGVRGGQVSAMTAQEFSRIVDRRTQQTICFLYSCPKHKDKKSAKRKATETHVCDRNYNDLIEEMITAALKTTHGRLVPDWKQTEANAKIKEAAVDLEWDEDFVWVNHGVRHGAIQDAANSDDDASEEERIAKGAARAAHGDQAVTKNVYCVSELERKVNVQQTRQNTTVGASLPSVSTVNEIPVSPSKVPKKTGRGRKKKANSATPEKRDPHTGKRKTAAAGKKDTKKATPNSVVDKLLKNKKLKVEKITSDS